MEAFDDAQQSTSDLWEFAVPVDELEAAGLTSSALRLLCREGYLEHATETTRPESKTRRFSTEPNLAFGKKTCFVLTVAGAAAIRQAAKRWGRHKRRLPKEEKPHWNSELGELCWRGKLVKRLTATALNQRRILDEFQGNGWEERIGNPLPKDSRVNPKKRMNQTIKQLNRNQLNTGPRFHGDGSGLGVRWRRGK